jgi:hypothetical protein
MPAEIGCEHAPAIAQAEGHVIPHAGVRDEPVQADDDRETGAAGVEICEKPAALPDGPFSDLRTQVYTTSDLMR